MFAVSAELTVLVLLTAMTVVAQPVLASAPAPSRSQPSRSAAKLAPLPAGSPHKVVPTAGGVSSVSAFPAGKLTGKGPKTGVSFDAKSSYVDPSLTTATREVFVNADGSRTVQLAAAPQRWLDPASKTWKTFDTTLTPSASADTLSAKSLPAGSSVATNAAAGALVTAPSASGPVSLSLPDLASVPATVQGSSATFADALSDGRTVAVVLLPNGFKSSVTAESSAAPSTFNEVLTVPAGAKAAQSDAGVQLYGPNGSQIGFYGEGTAIDASGARVDVTTTLVGQQGTQVTVSEAVDTGWWTDPSRSFPVVVDPIYTEKTDAAGAVDTYVLSTSPTGTHDGQSTLQVGNGGGSAVFRSLLRWDLSDLLNTTGGTKVVLDSQLQLRVDGGPSCTAEQMDVYNVTGTWGTGATWSNQPSIGSNVAHGTFAHGYSSACPFATESIDLTPQTQSWVNSEATNNGIELRAHNESDTLSKWALASAETGTTYAPTLSVTVDTLPTNATLSAPAADSFVSTATPTLTVSPGSDPDSDPLSYRFLISMDPNPSVGGVYATAFTSSTSFQVPEGVLQDGVTYYWTVQTFDGLWWPSTPPDGQAFTVDLGLGLTGQEPTDAAGDATVNLVNGNMTTGVSTPSYPTVGGSQSIGLVYNSRTQPVSGLNAAYYDFSLFHLSHDISAGDIPRVTRVDPTIDFNWGMARRRRASAQITSPCDGPATSQYRQQAATISAASPTTA